MSRLLFKYAKQLTCCVALLLTVGAQQLTSAAPIVMCTFDNCFDAGRGRESDGVGIGRESVRSFLGGRVFDSTGGAGVVDSQLRTSFTQVGLRPQVGDPIEDSFSVNSQPALDVSQTFAHQDTDPGKTFSLVANSGISSAGASGAGFTVQGAVAAPEPTTLLLLGAGLAGLGMRFRKK